MKVKLIFFIYIISALIYFFIHKPFQSKDYNSLNSISDTLNSINVYFNGGADTSVALNSNCIANYHVNLEDRLISRLTEAYSSVDIAIYEINLPRLVNTIIEKAADSVSIRLIVDAKFPKDEYYRKRYRTMRLLLEKMKRGKDKKIGTFDDVNIMADAPIFAVTDDSLRRHYGLPATYRDLSYEKLFVGRKFVKGYLLCKGELKKEPNKYYSGLEQMHNKFVIIDNMWVWTGSWNFTVTGLYGSYENMKENRLNGNIQNSIEIKNFELANAYKKEFNEMWGSNKNNPNIRKSRFHSRKKDNVEHRFRIGGRLVELYFSPADSALTHMKRIVKNNADSSIYFEIFAWSRQDILDVLKKKWEGSIDGDVGIRTGFVLRGVFESLFYKMWWSASVDMNGEQSIKDSPNNPNTRWKNRPDIYGDCYAQKLHSKFMIIDVNSISDPTVITGSANWSVNGEFKNDENILIIHDSLIANQYYQSFVHEYKIAKKEYKKSY